MEGSTASTRRALLALALTIAIVIKILVPLIVQGVPPIPVAVVLATGITVLGASALQSA